MEQNDLYEQMEAWLAAWASTREDVRAVIVIGSRARKEDHPADEWSDLDTIVFVDDSTCYTDRGDWSAALEQQVGKPVWFPAFDRLAEHEVEWETVFDDGSKLDMVFSTNRSPRGREAGLAEMIEGFPFHNVLMRGMRVLVEKVQGPPVTLGQPAAPTLPDAAAFERQIHVALLEMFRAWKLAGRGELWRSARVVNYQMHDALLPLIGWHALALHGKTPGPYGRFLEEWADPNVLALLEGVYAKNTRESITRALQNAQRLLALLVIETVEKTNLPYPVEALEKMGAWVE